MSTALTRGWCPDLYTPMAAGDGFLVRVKPAVSGVSAAQLRVLADAAEAYGSGRVEITNRGNFQIRGLSAETVPAFAGAMLAEGLASADPAVERRRNLLLHLPVEPEMLRIALELEAWLEADDMLDALPGKFGFAVGGMGADINLFPGKMVLPGGFAAMTEQPVAAARVITHAFLRLAGAGVTRMTTLLAATGAEAVFAEAGLPMQTVQPLAATPQIGPMADNFGLGTGFGQLDAAMLRHAAELAERFGDGWLHTTGARSLVVMGTGGNADAIATATQGAGFITTPDDVRLRIAACAGQPACPQALVDARAVAAGLAPHWAGSGVLHVSACTKGCAAPRGAAVTLVAQGRTYALVLNGRAQDAPVAAGLSLDETVQWMRQRRLYR
jgi:precorrin-3B synthase